MTDNLHNIRSSGLKETETFRTPSASYCALFDYAPEWFAVGCCFDPSAGDGRMVRELVKRGNAGPHILNDIRDETSQWFDIDGQKSVGDFLSAPCPVFSFLVTNPPFTLAQKFVEHALPSAWERVCILQSVAFQGTARRSRWLKGSGLRYVLNLPTRPKWEVDDKQKVFSNVWDFAWFVFEPDYRGLPEMDWLL